MKKMRLFSLLLAFFLIVSGILAPVSADPAVTSGCHSVDAATSLSDEGKLTDTAKAAILYELNSGTMIYSWNPDERIYPTSMVKIMTTLVALENADLNETVTVTRDMRNQVPIGIIGIDLKYGEEISLRDLLYSTMVASATDASVIAAIHVGGSMENFLQMMNDKAAQLGCRDTSFGNVHGLHDEQTYTTARDICRIMEAALANETLRAMFRTVEYTVSATNKREEHVIKNTNHMMNPQNSKYYDERVTGGKTGATDEGGRCVTLTAEQDGMEILCIVMGAQPTMAENGSVAAYGSFEEGKILLDYAFENFVYRQVFFDGQSLTQYPVSDGTSHVVTQAATSVSTVVPVQMEESQLRWAYQESGSSISAPVNKGQTLGTVQVWYGSKCLAQTEMVAMNAVEVYQAPVVPKKPEAVFGGSWLMLLLILAGIAAVGFLVVLSMRATQIIRHQRKHKRRSRRR